MCQTIIHNVHRGVKAQMIINRDPTRTTALRNLFVRDMNSRFNEIKKVYTKSILVEDTLELRDNEVLITLLEEMVTAGFRAFDFPTNTKKVAGFMNWINRQVDAGILDVRDITQIGESINGAWSNKYIFDSYSRAVIRARTELQKAGFDVPSIKASGGIDVVMMAPIHLDRVGLLYTRSFSTLKGITAAMDTQISQVLAQGLIDGKGPRSIARDLVQTVSGKNRSLELKDSLGRTIGAQRRAEILARTETIRAHAHGTLQEYKNWGAVGVSVKAEFITAGDNRVCAQCANLEGSVFKIEDAWKIIPVHAQCRCAWIPTSPTDVPQQVRPPSNTIEAKIAKNPVARNMKNVADAKRYLEYEKKYTKQLKQLFKKEPGLLAEIEEWNTVGFQMGESFPASIRKLMSNDRSLKKFTDMFKSWQQSTQKQPSMLFKMRAESVENIGKTIFNPDGFTDDVLKAMRKAISNRSGDEIVLSVEEYLNGRAFGQAWLKSVRSNKKSWELFRGTDGNEGEKFRDLLKNHIDDVAAGKNPVFKWNITDSSMAGYTEGIGIADGFGAHSGGVTIRSTMRAKEVFWPRELISGYNMVHIDEMEWVVHGLKKRAMAFKDLQFSVQFKDKFDRTNSILKLMDESLDDFMKRWNEIQKKLGN